MVKIFKMDNERNALHNFLISRGITVEDFLNKKLMLDKDNRPISCICLNLILQNLTIKISKENFNRIAMAYDLTVIEKSDLSKMVIQSWRVVKGGKSSKNLLDRKNIEIKRIIQL